VHERIRRRLVMPWTEAEWTVASMGHPVARLYLKGEADAGNRLLREYTAAHEAGHALMATHVGMRVRRAQIATLRVIEDAETGTAMCLGFCEYQDRAHDVVSDLLVDLAGIAGHELVYGNGWGLDSAAWTAPEDVGELADEGIAGGDVWTARETIKRQMRMGRRVLGKATTVEALVAAYEQAEAILNGCRGRLLRLAGHLLSEGAADRSVIRSTYDLGE